MVYSGAYKPKAGFTLSFSAQFLCCRQKNLIIKELLGRKGRLAPAGDKQVAVLNICNKNNNGDAAD